MSRRHPASLLLIREWEQQMSSSGCCGRLEGDLLSWSRDGQRCFPERRRVMEGAGALYREVQELYGKSVEIRIVDPRNPLSLLPLLLRDFRRYGVGVFPALRTLFGISVASVVVNGRLVSRGEWPEASKLLPHLGPPPPPYQRAGRPRASTCTKGPRTAFSRYTANPPG